MPQHSSTMSLLSGNVLLLSRSDRHLSDYKFLQENIPQNLCPTNTFWMNGRAGEWMNEQNNTVKFKTLRKILRKTNCSKVPIIHAPWKKQGVKECASRNDAQQQRIWKLLVFSSKTYILYTYIEISVYWCYGNAQRKKALCEDLAKRRTTNLSSSPLLQPCSAPPTTTTHTYWGWTRTITISQHTAE